jgi:FKBP-type peptidyl-prolyl cis-trans isomerase
VGNPLPLPSSSFPSPTSLLSYTNPNNTSTTFTMGVEKQTLKEGNGVDYPKKGEHVAIHYTGCLYDESKADNHFMGAE